MANSFLLYVRVERGQFVNLLWEDLGKFDRLWSEDKESRVQPLGCSLVSVKLVDPAPCGKKQMDDTLCADEIRLIRQAVKDLLSDYADRSVWIKYQKDVPIADHRSELICMWFDDVYSPDWFGWEQVFTSEERIALAAFTDVFEGVLDDLPSEYTDLLDSPEWARVAQKAAEVSSTIAV